MNLMLEIIGNILTDETVWNILTTGIVAGVGYLMQKIVKDTAARERAKDALVGAANDLYPTVKAWKEVNENKKLTPDQRNEAQSRAIDRATEIGQNTGVDVMKILGPTVARAILEQAVASLKPKEVQLAPAVANMLPDANIQTLELKTGEALSNLSEESIQTIVDRLADRLKETRTQ